MCKIHYLHLFCNKHETGIFIQTKPTLVSSLTTGFHTFKRVQTADIPGTELHRHYVCVIWKSLFKFVKYRCGQNKFWFLRHYVHNMNIKEEEFIQKNE